MRLLIPLFSPATGTWGGLTRVVAVAEAARAAGDEVAFCASGYLESMLRKRGYRVFPTPPTTMFGLPPALSQVLERRSQRVSLPVRPGKDFGSIWTVLTVSGMARGRYLRRLAEAERKAASTFGADALFTDLDPGAFLLSRLTGLPIASTYADVMRRGTGSFAWKMMNRALRAVLQAEGQRACGPEELYFGPSVLKIIPSVPELDGTDPARDDVYYAGQLLGGVQPSGTASPFIPRPGRRYLFVYVGTGSISLDTLRRVLPAVCASQPDLSCVVGAQSIGRVERLGEVEFRPYVDAGTLLPHAEWTICHGGQNTIVESLVHGVPLLIFPGPIFERRFNARKVAEAGAGFMGERADFTPEWIETAMQAKESQAKAAQLGSRIKSYAGVTGAVQQMHQKWGTPAR